MKDLKNKLTESANKVKDLAEKKIKEIDVNEVKVKLKDINVSDVKEKIKETTEKTNKKLEESGVKGKVSKALSEDNKNNIIAKVSLAKSCLKCIKLPSTKVLIAILAVVVVSVVAFVATCLLSEKEPKPVIINGYNTNHIYEENKIFGEGVFLDDNSRLILNDKKIVIGIIGYKVKSILKAKSYRHMASGKSFSDTSFVVTAKNPIFGGDVEFIFKKAKIKADNGDMLKGYHVTIANTKVKTIYKNDFHELIFTEYYKPKK